MQSILIYCLRIKSKIQRILMCVIRIKTNRQRIKIEINKKEAVRKVMFLSFRIYFGI